MLLTYTWAMNWLRIVADYLKWDAMTAILDIQIDLFKHF